jgi:hypothetical protein
MSFPDELNEKIFQYAAELEWIEQLQTIIGPFNDFMLGLLAEGEAAEGETEPLRIITAVYVLVKYREILACDGQIMAELEKVFREYFYNVAKLPLFLVTRGEGRRFILTTVQDVAVHMEQYGRWRAFT